jgi:hypothetical protein
MAVLVTVGDLVEFVDEGGVLRGGGQRVMTLELLTKVASRMNDLGERIAHTAIRAWMPEMAPKPPGKATLVGEIERLTAKEAAAKSAGDWRDAIYYEVAAFCCRAHLDRK